MRQGDPLSPSLFIIAEEVLSRGLSWILQEGKVQHYHLGRGVLPISHLLFADDTVIFLNGSRRSVVNLMNFMQSYELASGQKVSKGKSSRYVSPNLPVTSLIMHNTGMLIKAFPFIYLACPISYGRIKNIYFKPSLAKMRKKFEGWYGIFLSFAGRIVLAKHVLNSMPLALYVLYMVAKGCSS